MPAYASASLASERATSAASFRLRRRRTVEEELQCGAVKLKSKRWTRPIRKVLLTVQLACTDHCDT
jgi:hypothetical protein